MHKNSAIGILSGLVSGFIGTGCINVDNGPGKPSNYGSPTEGAVTTLYLDSQDIIEASRAMVPALLASPQIVTSTGKLRLAIDGTEFRNLSHDPIAVQAFTDRLRTELQRAGNDRLTIINPERGRTDGSAQDADHTPTDYDYCLGGTITSTMQPRDARGRRSSSYQIVFELYRPGTREIVWSKPYDFKKVAQEPTIYR